MRRLSVIGCLLCFLCVQHGLTQNLDAERIYSQVESMPRCVECGPSKANMYKMDVCTQQSFTKWINENMVYPPQALEDQKAALCEFKVIIDTMGQFETIQLVSEVDPMFYDEAFRLMHAYHGQNKWLAATQKNKKVKVILNLEIKFDLSDWAKELQRRKQVSEQMRLDSIQKSNHQADSLRKAQSAQKKKKK